MPIESRYVVDFEEVVFFGPGSLNISQQDSESLTVHAPTYVMSDIVTEVKGGVLEVGYRSPPVTPIEVMREVISFDLAVKDIGKISVLGRGLVQVPDFDSDTLALDISGSGKVRLEHLTADKLEVSIRGSGSLTAQGDVETQLIDLQGSGSYEADHLVSDFVRILLGGTGSIAVSVLDELDVTIRGSGQVIYHGFPDVSRSVLGSGCLLRRQLTKEIHKQGEDHG